MKNTHYSRLALLSFVLFFGIALNSCSPDQFISPLIAPTSTKEIVPTPSEAESKQLTATMTSTVSPTPSNTPTITLTPTFTTIPTDTPTFTPSIETFELQVTQEELTEIVDTGFSSTDEATMENNTVVLTNNTMEIRSQVTQMGFKLPMEVILTVSADSCKPVANIKSSSVGPFALPDYGKEEMKGMVKAILLDKLQKLSENACVQKIEIEEGVIILSGEIQ
jgi:hypothetical protein